MDLIETLACCGKSGAMSFIVLSAAPWLSVTSCLARRPNSLALVGAREQFSENVRSDFLSCDGISSWRQLNYSAPLPTIRSTIAWKL